MRSKENKLRILLAQLFVSRGKTIKNHASAKRLIVTDAPNTRESYGVKAYSKVYYVKPCFPGRGFLCAAKLVKILQGF